MASTNATTDTRTNSTTADPPCPARPLSTHSVKADLVQEPGDDLPQGLIGGSPDQDHHGLQGNGGDNLPLLTYPHESGKLVVSQPTIMRR
jgi:hypothetical protein